MSKKNRNRLEWKRKEEKRNQDLKKSFACFFCYHETFGTNLMFVGC